MYCIIVNIEKLIVIIEVGVNFGIVYKEFWNYGVIIFVGISVSVGVVGLVFGGGIGMFLCLFGLICD